VVLKPPYTQPEEIAREQVEEILRNNLLKKYVNLSLGSLVLRESQSTSLELEIIETESNKKKIKKMSCSGVGLVDSIFSGIKGEYGKKFKSLNNIFIECFHVVADMKTRENFDGSDSKVIVVLEARTKDSSKVVFRSFGRSMIESTVKVVLNTVAFYINAEKCFYTLRTKIKEANNRGRGDISQRYTSDIIEIVKISKYGEK